jgi:hypothetical protein
VTFRRLVAVVAAALAASLLASGCQGGVHPAPASAERGALAADIERLRADDGLFSATADLGEPGLYTSAFGLAALAVAGRDTRVRLTPAALRAAVADQVRADPLWGRAQLALLERTLRVPLHDDGDVAALRALRGADGSFTDPAVSGELAGNPQYRRSATAAAVSALAAFGSPLDGTERQTTADWLDAGATVGTGLSIRWQLVQARDALGLPPPADLPATLNAWWATTGSRLTGPATGDDLVEVCAYVRLATVGRVDLTSHRAALIRALDPARTLPGDPQIGYLLASAWQEVDGGPAGLGPLVGYLEAHRLGSGLVAATQQRLGDLQASYLVQALRAEAGLPTRDRRLAQALVARRSYTLDGSSPAAGNLWLATLATAGGDTGTPDARRLRQRAPEVLPGPITVDTAVQWSQLATTLETLDLPLPDVDVRAWPTDSPEHRYASNLLVPHLVHAHRRGRLSPPASPPELARDGVTLLATGALGQSSAAFAAAGALGWRPTGAEAEHIRALLRPLKGCPRTPALYHEAAARCDVNSTLAGWTIQRLLADR